MTPTTCVYHGDELGRYGFQEGHPFGPSRQTAFWDELLRRGLVEAVEVREPVEASREEIERFHAPEYVERVQTMDQRGGGYLDGGDTPAFPGVYEASSYVVGSSLDAARRIMAGRCRRAFVPIAGLHHAGRDRAAGFCVFNDCGVVIESLRSEMGLRRVAYVDIDAHHGDGVFYAFEGDPELAFADLHEDGRFLFPGTGRKDETGRGAAAGTKLNIPLPPGAGDAEFRTAWETVERYLRAAEPEFILLQCGADGLRGDPLTHLAYSAEAHAHATGRLVALAEELGHGRILALGGGGYDLGNIAAAWCAVVEELLTPGDMK